MTRTAKREQLTSSRNGRRGAVDVSSEEQLKAVKREHLTRNRAESNDDEADDSIPLGVVDRRFLRSRYLAVKNLINDKRDDLARVDSDKFSSIISEVENLHQLVQKPREQVADAEALLDIANTLMSSVKSQNNEGVTPSDFVTFLLSDFGAKHRGIATSETGQNSIRWKDIGLAVSNIFREGRGCCTMLGPMNTELKQRKVGVRGKRVRPTESARPEELNDTGKEERTDTDKNMATMFEILRRKKRVRLECLLLSRKSFAQTVENLFAMSFLVKDGRAEVVVDENGSHFVSPRNAPAANSVMSGEVTYGHFVFRFDFSDWKLMKDLVADGEELMPHRVPSNVLVASWAGPVPDGCKAPIHTTPIRKLSRNRGLVIQEQSVVEDSPEIDDDDADKANGIRRCRRKLI